MLTNPELVLKTLYRIYYGLSDRSPEFKVKWRSTIDIIFEESADIVKDFTITRQAKFRLKTSQDCKIELQKAPEDIAAEILASLKVLHDKAVEIQEYTQAQKLILFVEEILENKADVQSKILEKFMRIVVFILTPSRMKK